MARTLQARAGGTHQTISVRGPERVKEGPGLPPVPSEAPSFSQRPLLLAQHSRARQCQGRPANRVNEGLSSQGMWPQENSGAGLGMSCQEGGPDKTKARGG